MNGELAQSVILVAHGNAYLNSSRGTASADPLAGRDLFSYVRNIRFGKAPARQPEEASLKWFRSLQRRGATRLWLMDGLPRRTSAEFPRRVMEGFSNANPRGIWVELPKRNELWLPNWHFGRGHRWLVRYLQLDVRGPIAVTQPKVEQAIETLETRLKAARYFASEEKQDSWVKVFAAALAALRNPHPICLEEVGQNTFLCEGVCDWLPDGGYRESARRLLVGASTADVFRGMGSWNDMGFSDPKRQATYEQVSEDLYQAVITGIVAAANAFCPFSLPDAWPITVIELAKSLKDGADCAFALHDALIESGCSEIAEHFESREHPTKCWALNLILHPRFQRRKTGNRRDQERMGLTA
jgi:hypothetical protein